ncbi:MAG: hypothetical protein WAM71_14580, partial [Candidatus Korobacteraceae bacterium]
SHLPAGSCSLLYLNPPYDVEMGRHSNQRLELLFLDHCYGWLKTAGVLIFIIPEIALTHCAKRLASQFVPQDPTKRCHTLFHWQRWTGLT